MKHLTVFVVVLLAGLLNACVSAEKYDNLKAQNNELKQTLETQERMGEDAGKVHRATIADLKDQNQDLQKQLTAAIKELRGQREALKELRRE